MMTLWFFVNQLYWAILGFFSLRITLNGVQILKYVLDFGALRGNLSSNLHRELKLPPGTPYEGGEFGSAIAPTWYLTDD